MVRLAWQSCASVEAPLSGRIARMRFRLPNPDVLAGGHNAECRDRRDRTTKVAVDVVHHDLLVLMLQDCPQVGSEVFRGRFSLSSQVRIVGRRGQRAQWRTRTLTKAA